MKRGTYKLYKTMRGQSTNCIKNEGGGDIQIV